MSNSAENSTTRDRVKKLIKAYFYVNPKINYWEFKFCLILYLVYSIFICHIEITRTYSFFKMNIPVGFKSIIMSNIMQMYFISLFILDVLDLYFFRFHKQSIPNKLFFTQLPVQRKDVLSTRYTIFFLFSIPALINVVCLIFINFYKGTINYISSYTGLLILCFSLWFIIMCAFTGYIDSLNKNNNYIQILANIFILLLLLIILYASHLDIRNSASEEFMYNSFGTRFAPVLKSLRYIGGIGGIFILLAVEALGYYLCCMKPIIRLERRLKK